MATGAVIPWCLDHKGAPWLALSQDLRERVIAAVEASAACRQAAERFGIGKAGAIRWHARFTAG